MAINIEPSEDGSAKLLFQNHKYTMGGLKIPAPGWAERYNVHEAPVNMLIDRDGKFVTRLDFDTAESSRLSVQDIEALLSRTP